MCETVKIGIVTKCLRGISYDLITSGQWLLKGKVVNL